jgi:flagellar biosynthesis regulator FlbT
MDCRKLKVLALLKNVKKLVMSGRAPEALQKMCDAEKILTPQEREKIMNIFTSSVIERGRQDIERYQETLVVAT